MSNNQVYKFITDVAYEKVDSGIPASWNDDGSAYKSIYEALEEKRAFDLNIINIEGEKPFQQTEQIKNTIESLATSIRPSSIPLFDFSEFRLTVNLLDDIVEPLKKIFGKLKKGLVILLPLDKLPEVRQSYYLGKLADSIKGKNKGILFVEQNGKTHRLGNYLTINKLLKIEALSESVNIPTEKIFKKHLIQRSQRWFGHFAMTSGVHVRTHYDCHSEILTNNWLFGYAANESGRFIESTKPDIIIGFGLAEVAVTHFTVLLSSKYNIDHMIKSKGITLNFDNHKGVKRVLLVSDIILTGLAATEIATKLEKNGMTIVGLLCVLGLRNSVKSISKISEIKMLTQIDRPFYQPGKCPLCDCNYPITKVNTVDDFRHLPEKINAYDFWEGVQESTAFSNTHREIHGRHYTYYVDISKLLVIYAESIARQLCYQARNVLELAMPSVILYPEGEAAAILSSKVAHLLKENFGEIIEQPVPRQFLDDINHTAKFMPPDGFDVDSIRHKQVIVVDDGCCSFDTFAAMDELIKRIGSKLVVYCVILNRSTKELYNRKREQYKDRFQCYYHWPVTIYTDKYNCLECD